MSTHKSYRTFCVNYPFKYTNATFTRSSTSFRHPSLSPSLPVPIAAPPILRPVRPRRRWSTIKNPSSSADDEKWSNGGAGGNNHHKRNQHNGEVKINHSG